MSWAEHYRKQADIATRAGYHDAAVVYAQLANEAEERETPRQGSDLTETQRSPAGPSEQIESAGDYEQVDGDCWNRTSDA